MFASWKEFMEIFNKEGNDDHSCESCGTEDFDFLCKEKDDKEDALSAIFICKNCGIQKKIAYKELETN